MLLCNLQTIESNVAKDIRILDRKIIETDISLKNKDEHSINFENAIAFPGLINSHDHLDFNLFPQLGNRRYSNYVEWGNDIQAHNKDIISKVLQVPLKLRLQWGIYKNLINGFTTVVNHGPKINEANDLITVFEKCNILHSIQFEKNWKLKLNRPGIQKFPFVIHIGEGIDNNCRNEIDRLIQWNIFKKDIIGVHGIVMNEKQAKHFKGLVWCPASNFFLIGETAQVNKLKDSTNLLFGTDSTLTATWNLWEHLRMVRNKQYATDRELFDMLTIIPANTWKLEGCGKLESGYDSDIVIGRANKSNDTFNSFYNLNPEELLMVVSKGKIRLFDAELLIQMDGPDFQIKEFSKIIIKGSIKYIYGDLPRLMNQIKTYYPEVDFPVEM